MYKMGFDKVLILSLFSAHIYEREDFENPEKFLHLKDNLEQDCYVASLSVDQELNLYKLAVKDKDKKETKPSSTTTPVATIITQRLLSLSEICSFLGPRGSVNRQRRTTPLFGRGITA